MCNLYNVTTNQQAIRSFISITHDSIGNLEPSLDIYPDRLAPIVRNIEGGRQLAMVRWGMPSSSQALYKAATIRAVHSPPARTASRPWFEIMPRRRNTPCATTAGDASSAGGGASFMRASQKARSATRAAEA